MKSGLSSEQANLLLRQNGYNEIKAKKISFFIKVLRWLLSPITLMLLAAAGLSLASHRVFDCYFILSLTLLNFGISFWQEHKADNAIASLQQKLAISVKTLRDGTWQQIPSRELVVGDEIALGVGDLVPADMKLTSSQNVSINEASLTGESLPKEKSIGNTAFSGSYLVTGAAQGLVTATGAQTAFGKTLISVEKANKRSLLERDILTIAYLLAAFSLVAVAILTLVLFRQHQPLNELLRLDLSLLIAGVPVSMPTVMAIIISLGVLRLSQKQVVVRQMSALENLSNVNLLLSDKTGTLTENQIAVAKIITFDGNQELDVITYALLSVDDADKNPIERAIAESARRFTISKNNQVTNLIPADSSRKRVTAHALVEGKKTLISVGAPQVIAALCRAQSVKNSGINQKVQSAARDGYRVLAVAAKQPDDNKEANLRLIGLLLLSDTVRPEAKSALAFLRRQGIMTHMVTGDNQAIGRQVADKVGIKGAVLTREAVDKLDLDKLDRSWWNDKAAFAEILPQDKFHLVQAAKRNFVVAVTGDGINDLPAINEADVGIAVSNAVDALKSSADIVMLAPGISVIRTALLEARKIFERLYSYTVYRISESFRLIITIAILGLAIHTYPITPIQLILLAFLNDLPIVSLAYNRVNLSGRPSKSRSRKRLYRGLLHGSVGVASSLSLYYVLAHLAHLSLSQIQTAFFLKLTVSGHMLIFVAHTDEPWYHFVPSPIVIAATTLTQLFASLLAGFGLLMPAISLGLIVFVWLWSFAWMQVSDLAKKLVPQK